ncbi:Exodeoxyribonuclease VII large subunit [Prevotella sp. tc2-28]|uniref:exodeoxyribonuclease VII large subunit n=1 Tax=Prevotella sp. tc2-28 TaxID=1761888 RepID=UPI0008999ED0|nr:exodeoxyribonuclease VII large subunit [Prevotella sp. tc2-28]SDZ90282.1 Exodeoxyribonuclease VII large subunit [Prevotella sp. tc2-28]
MNKSYALSQLNKMVRDAIDMQLPDEYWVEAELSECREHNGHCYLELIEKDEHTNTPVARASAKCWRQTWLMVKPYFERTTGEPLRTGMKVLLKVYAQFHEAFGFSWIVTDIDPNYTLGDMARKRLEIIRQLKEEGVFDLQRELHIPLFAKRIAVISAEHAAGYGDFCRQLEDNEYGFRFEVTLFPAIMQGEQVEQSIIAALERIYALNTSFDVVVIIRGGGATADLSGFDTLALAENVAQFPLPVITGIGHERDESILDMVAHTRVKTPTAAAALLIDHLRQVLERINSAQQRISTAIFQRIANQKMRLTNLQTLLPALVQRNLAEARHRIEMLEVLLKSHDPQRLLSRGYSITLLNGRAVRDPQQLKAGDVLETRVEKGTIKSTVL